MSILSQQHFHDEQAAYDFVEARDWAKGRVCPNCGTVDRSGKLNGKSTRIGTYKYYACRKPFTVKVGTIFEASHVKMHIWLQGIFLISSSKQGVSANQLHCTLGVTLKTAWFMGRRIREVMRSDNTGLLGGGGGIVEADETYFGQKEGIEKRPYGYAHKMKVLSLVERGGSVRSMVLDRVTKEEVRKALTENIAREARLMTDSAPYYRKRDFGFANHQIVDHRKGEYVKGDCDTNTLEGYFSIFKRGRRGTYQHCREKHLHRYMAGFDFRYNNRIAASADDKMRTEEAIRGIVGKRLTYQTVNSQVRG